MNTTEQFSVTLYNKFIFNFVRTIAGRFVELRKLFKNYPLMANQNELDIIINFMKKQAKDPLRVPRSSFPLKRELIDNLLDAAIVTFLGQPMLVEVAPPVTLFGDMHGQYDDLISWFDYIGWPPTRRCLFLGDYVDRGDFNLEVIILLLALKVAHPNDLFLLRGNHETVATNRSYGFLAECETRFTAEGDRMYRRLNHVFSCMPMAGLVADQMLCMHGGLSPTLKSLDQIRRIKRPVDVTDYGLLCDLCWSDPNNQLSKGAGYPDSPRGAGHMFGKDTCKDLCTRLNLTFVTRAHQVPEPNGGFQFTFGSPKDHLMTLFSAPAYMRKSNDGAVMMVDEKATCTLKILRPVAHEKRRKE